MISEDMFDPAAFRLSRIYAQGWNARKHQSLKTNPPDAIANPYESEPERARWEQGFTAASHSDLEVARAFQLAAGHGSDGDPSKTGYEPQFGSKTGSPKWKPWK